MSNDLEQQLVRALNEIEDLKQENRSLRLQLSNYMDLEDSTSRVPSLPQIANEQEQASIGHVHLKSSAKEKIALFRSLFRGREDVYPVKWVNKAGKSGYSPACQNEWTVVCKKPQVKCSECTHQAFDPLSDEIIARHLDAKSNRTIGVYPMLQDETCWFIAMDFDKQNWQQDAAAVLATCKEWHIPAALERSRSGNGGHIWFFFNQPLEAVIARKLGCAILTKTMERRYQISLDSYDRLFPNQDTLPKGGFGNLIALPLQGVPRRDGNSVFVDETFRPYEDQWRYLSGLEKLSIDRVQNLIYELTKEGSLLSIGTWNDTDEDEQPWIKTKAQGRSTVKPDPLLSQVNVVYSNMIYIEKKGLPSTFIKQLQNLATFQNPDFYKTQAMRLPTYGKPRVIGCYEDFSKYIALPRGCFEMMLELMNVHQIETIISEERNSGNAIDVDFIGTLSMLQDGAARSMLAHNTGILSATTAFGKTVVAASIIASRKVNTLVLVHRRELMDQWRERLSTFLNLDKKDIGIVGGGKNKRTGIVDIAIIQSLNQKGNVQEYVEEYGQIIVDECHHVSAFSFEQVLKKAKAKYVVGLTATPTRQDGHQPIVVMQCGPIRIKIDAKSQAHARGIEHKVVPRYTNFRLPASVSSHGIQEVYQLLMQDEERNNLIFDDLLKVLEQGRSPILLTERTAHLDYFENRLTGFAKNVFVMRGGMGKKQREALREQIANIPDSEERVFIATGKLIGEGFDDARLDTLFLVHPISWKGTLQQYAGRLHRVHQSKQDVQIYDYIDFQVPMLMSMYKKRVKGYQVMGYHGMNT
ncbi:DEAD/DEAH box helicase family protein [Cohnella sp. REN36]|uniref:TOTE conflict system archaeo-eukaryotic primase domain-containing protein n=1 Tax=Cohnella sp. REN36 TaxID=2887347 RepID=UPI001D1410FD|nr:DEAD/DEAH box helicase [Cohnella sp. REN36]MCC3372253.1 DEAD/DEAH box helicase [Cohnella sp. REN36]